MSETHLISLQWIQWTCVVEPVKPVTPIKCFSARKIMYKVKFFPAVLFQQKNVWANNLWTLIWTYFENSYSPVFASFKMEFFLRILNNHLGPGKIKLCKTTLSQNFILFKKIPCFSARIELIWRLYMTYWFFSCTGSILIYSFGALIFLNIG